MNKVKHPMSVKGEKKPKEGDFSFVKAAHQVLSDLPGRAKEMLLGRFGVGTSHPLTLEEIGRTYRVTRERVRQIVRESLRKVRMKEKDPVLAEIRQKIEFTLEKNDGIMEEEQLLLTVAGNYREEQGALSLFLNCIEGVDLIDEQDKLELVYASSEFSIENWNKVYGIVIAILEETKNPLSVDELIEKIGDKVPGLTRDTLVHYLEVARAIKRNSFGKWGMAEWTEINPKGAREKSFAVLKEHSKPLHFKEIATLIDKHYRGKKKTHPQTVHNELIKDERFVLVGRGIYALSEWGYRKGTVKDILEDILKKSSGPLSRTEILDRIMKMRQVKKSTVMINLNNFFSKVGKDSYTLKR